MILNTLDLNINGTDKELEKPLLVIKLVKFGAQPSSEAETLPVNRSIIF
jgi:hypothetical protein